MRSAGVVVLLLWGLVPLLQAQPKQTDQQELPIRLVATPAQAQAVALLDLRKIPEHEQCYYRYIWIVEKTIPAFLATSLTINGVSWGVEIQRPAGVRVGEVLLARLDLRHYLPPGSDFSILATLWEEFRNDPKFSLLLTPGTLQAAIRAFGHFEVLAHVYHWEKQLVDCPEYVHPADGKTYSKRWEKQRICYPKKIKVGDLKAVEFIRLPSPLLDPEVYHELCQRTKSAAPVVSQPYWSYRTASSIQDGIVDKQKDTGVFKEIWGGLYFELLSVPQGKNGGSDEDALFEKLGVGDGSAGSARKIYERTRPDQRSAIFQSQVTGKSRLIEILPTLTGHVSNTTRLLSITHDLKDQDVDVDRHALMNLLTPKDRAREVIYELPNGLHAYDLFDDAGKRQREVPPDVANDHTIPEPYTRRLQTSSCKACHFKGAHNGWIATGNDVQKLVGPGQSLDILADLSEHGRFAQNNLDVIRRLAGLYGGDPDAAFSRGRLDYTKAVHRATGPWLDNQIKPTDLAREAVGKEVSIYRDYWYRKVDARQALFEMGVKVMDDKLAPKVLAFLLQPDPKAAVPIHEIGRVVIPEDIRLWALVRGISVLRQDWELAYPFAMHRAARNLANLKAQAK